jgi:hypothetical protein
MYTDSRFIQRCANLLISINLMALSPGQVGVPKVAVEWLAFLLLSLPIPVSYFGPHTVFLTDSLWFFSASSGTCLDVT